MKTRSSMVRNRNYDSSRDLKSSNSETNREPCITDDENEDLHRKDCDITKNHKHKLQKNISSNGLGCMTIISIVIAAIAVFSVGLFVYSSLFENNEDSQLNCTDDVSLKSHFEKLREAFPSQFDDTWSTVASNIKIVCSERPFRPTSFLIVYKNGDKTVNCLIPKLTKFASLCLNSSTETIYVESEKLKEEVADDSGKLVNMLKKRMSDSGIMVVRNINLLPGEVIKEFHYFCDTYNPIVSKAVYFFTLSHDEYIHEEKINFHVEKLFKKLWGDKLESYILEPLISRMVVNIIPIQSEERFFSGC